MAYDGYHPSSSPYDQMRYMNQTGPDINNSNNNDVNYHDPRSMPYPPYPSQYTPDQVSMPQPQMPPAPSLGLNPEPYQNQTVPPPLQRPSPGSINDAVNSAFHKTETPSYLSPDVVSQITANVIQQLKVSGLDSGLQSGQQQQPNQNNHYHQQQQQQQWTPTTASGSAAYPSSPYPEPPPHPSSQYAAAVPPPSVATDDIKYQSPPIQSNHFNNHLHHGPNSSPVPLPERSASSFTESEEPSYNETRQSPPPRVVTELTTLEKIWGKLFEDGRPTERLGQFLRGVAVHLIEDYPPRNTIVVLPDKMQKFYHDTNVPSDPYPWKDIFDDRSSSISRLYRQAKAEHHLVQDDLTKRPDIPGLTPRGFQRWATLMILSHPDKEYERLAKAVLDMPISNPDDKKERFPKEIPRNLFPDAPDLRLREELDEFITAQCSVDLPRIASGEHVRVPASGPFTSSDGRSTKSPPASFEESTSFGERGRQPHVAEVADDEEEDPEEAPANLIERQRNPYTAQPGGGKVYNEPGKTKRGHASSLSTPTAHDGTAVVPPLAEPYGPDSPYLHAGPGPSYHPKHRHRRSSSFSTHGDYRHSESDLLDHDAASRYAADHRRSNPPSSALLDDIIDDGRRYRDHSERGWGGGPRIHSHLRGRERERERSRHRHDHHDRHPHGKSNWSADEEYYRGMLGRHGASPVGSGNGYDYKTYTYR